MLATDYPPAPTAPTAPTVPPIQLAVRDHVKVKFDNKHRPYALLSNKPFDGIVERIVDEWINQSMHSLGKHKQIFINFIEPFNAYPILVAIGLPIFCILANKQTYKCIVDSITFDSVIVYVHKYGLSVNPILHSIPYSNIVSILITQHIFDIQKI